MPLHLEDTEEISKGQNRGGTMARIKHIALASEDPAKTAAFYMDNFGLAELRREPADTGADGVWLSDGYIYFAILKVGNPDVTTTLAPGATGTVDHIGFYVDDLEESCEAVEKAGSIKCDNSSEMNRKYADPDGIMLDIRYRGWDEQIGARTQLYELTPAKTPAQS